MVDATGIGDYSPQHYCHQLLSSEVSLPINIYIDADACPVKQEIYRVAERHALKGTALKALVVSNSPVAVPRDPMIERVVVGSNMNEADKWIAERAAAGAIVITAFVERV